MVYVLSFHAQFNMEHTTSVQFHVHILWSSSKIQTRSSDHTYCRSGSWFAIVLKLCHNTWFWNLQYGCWSIWLKRDEVLLPVNFCFNRENWFKAQTTSIFFTSIWICFEIRTAFNQIKTWKEKTTQSKLAHNIKSICIRGDWQCFWYPPIDHNQ